MQQTKETYHVSCESCSAEADISAKLWDNCCGRDIPVPLPNNDLPLWCAIYPKTEYLGWEDLLFTMHALKAERKSELLDESTWCEIHVVDGWFGGGISYVVECPKCSAESEIVAVFANNRGDYKKCRQELEDEALGIVEAIVAMKRGW